MTTTTNLQVDAIAETIGIPIEQWEGNCHGIANALIEHEIVSGKTEYGFWLGPIHKNSYFDHTQPLVRHGWIKLHNGLICDPTRWVFEATEPYIYVGLPDHYDHGMRSTRRRRPGVESMALEFLDAYHHGERDFEIEDLYNIANGFPEDYKFIVAETYEALDELGHREFIPIDFWKEVME